jgi:hypothetical protein
VSEKQSRLWIFVVGLSAPILDLFVELLWRHQVLGHANHSRSDKIDESACILVGFGRFTSAFHFLYVAVVRLLSFSPPSAEDGY